MVRLLDIAGEVVGSGFLIGPDLVATCAHVVADALRADAYAEQAPHVAVLVGFPLVRGLDDTPTAIAAMVHHWSPIRADGTGDVAVLRLERPAPAGARMPRQPAGDDDRGRDHRAVGRGG